MLPLRRGRRAIAALGKVPSRVSVDYPHLLTTHGGKERTGFTMRNSVDDQQFKQMSRYVLSRPCNVPMTAS